MAMKAQGIRLGRYAQWDFVPGQGLVLLPEGLTGSWLCTRSLPNLRLENWLQQRPKGLAKALSVIAIASGHHTNMSASAEGVVERSG